MVQSFLRLFSISILVVAVRSYQVDYGLGHQCGQIEVAWSSKTPAPSQLVFPLQLNILPFNSTAVIKEITDWTNTSLSGSAVFPFNLTAGTKYIMGITDSAGNGVGTTSSVRTALASLTGSNACLPGEPKYEMSTPLLQGLYQVSAKSSRNNDQLTLNVNWDSSIRLPILRVFMPRAIPMNVGVLGGSSIAIPLPCGQLNSTEPLAIVLFGDGNLFRVSQVSLANNVCSKAAGFDDGGFGVYPIAAARTIGATAALISVVVIFVALITRCQRRRKPAIHSGGILTGEGIPRYPEPVKNQAEMVPNTMAIDPRPVSVVWDIPVYVRRPGVTVLGPGPRIPRPEPEPVDAPPKVEPPQREILEPAIKEPPRPSFVTAGSIGESNMTIPGTTRPLSFTRPRSRKESDGSTPSRKVRPRTAPPLSFAFSKRRLSMGTWSRRPSESSVSPTVRTIGSPQDSTESPQDMIPLPEGEPVPDSPTVPEFLRLPSFRFSLPVRPKSLKTISQRSLERSTYLELLEQWDGRAFRTKNRSATSLLSAQNSKKSVSRASSKRSRRSSKSRSSKKTDTPEADTLPLAADAQAPAMVNPESITAS